MNLILLPLLLMLGAEPKVAPAVPVGKETTFVTGPIDKDGLIDYEAALNERLRKNITPEKNSAVLFWRALGPQAGGTKHADFYKQLGMTEPPAKGDYYVGLGNFIANLKLQRNEIDDIADFQHRASDRVWSAKEYPYVAAWLFTNEKALNGVVEATRRPEYFSPVIARRADARRAALFTSLTHTQAYREAVTALAARALLRLGEDKQEEAWQDLLACHKMARMSGRGATLIELLVGISGEHVANNADLVYLAHAKLTSRQIQHRLKELQALPPLPLPADKIDLCERLVSLDCFQALPGEGFALIGDFIDLPKDLDADKGRKFLMKIDWTPIYRSVNQEFDRLVAAMRLPDRAERQAKLAQFDQEIAAMKKDVRALQEILVNLDDAIAQLEKAGAERGRQLNKITGNALMSELLPRAQMMQAAHDRVEQVRGNRDIAFALAAYRNDNNRYPKQLEELAPKYLAKIPGDLFTGKPLVYRPRKDGYLLYSFGPNGKDDDGRWYDDDPPGDDVRVRTPLPPLRPRER